MAATSNGATDRAFSIDAREVDDVCVLEVVGELDLAAAPALCARVEQTFRRRLPRVLVDLSRLEFCDSTGLRALLGVVQEARIRLARLRIEPAAARAFELAGAEFLPLVECPAAGVAELSR